MGRKIEWLWGVYNQWTLIKDNTYNWDTWLFFTEKIIRESLYKHISHKFIVFAEKSNPVSPL